MGSFTPQVTIPVATPPVRVIANHVPKEYFGFASLPPILTLPSFENIITQVIINTAITVI